MTAEKTGSKKNGNSLLIEAINAGNSSVANFLLRQKSLDITSMNSANRDALTVLAMLRDPKLKRVEKRLLKRKDLSLERITQRKTPLMARAPKSARMKTMTPFSVL